MRTKTNHFLFRRLSIQQRLPLLICTLLLVSVIIYGFANYYSLKKASLIIGKERLSSFIVELASSLSSSAQSLIKTVNATAAQKPVVECLKSGGNKFRKETIDALDKLHRDTTWVSVELLNKDFLPVLRSNKSRTDLKVNIKDIVSFVKVDPDSSKIGKIYNIKGLVYYPVITTVTDQKQTIGYIVSWIILHNTEKVMAQFSQLVGISADFYIENTDGSLWTNFIDPLPTAPFTIKKTHELIEFNTADSGRMIASAQYIPQTYWLVVIAFSEQNMLKGVNGFVKWILLIGIVLIAIGMLAAWTMSRSITRPLNKLMAAATAIAQGNYSSPVPVDAYQTDELGKLANAFNIMVSQIYRMHHELENKVEERTVQLEHVNKELEAFSYSVSHDLRTPLRAISGYSIMLKEDYEAELDTEGKRIIRNIINNAKMMGQLIDDLLSFSRLGKKELVSMQIDMQALAENIVKELLQSEPENKYHFNIGPLPPIKADQVMIKQVLINLVGNAIKYSSKKDAPEIEIGSIDEKTKTIYYVKDNGAGFDMAYANKLFGVFQRLHSLEEFEGSGVGLALVKRIIDKHKGEVWAEGFESKGATFYFSLPKI
jgi:signal transduction histidine kinase